jgi:flagellar basal-body rod modification protein FlgD
MAISTVSTAPAKSTIAKTDSTTTGFAENFNTFLTLLTTQLKNQDPLSPMNATEFTSQLVQFTSVEQAIKQNQTLTSLLAAQNSAQASSAVSFLGKTIEAKADTAQLTNGSAVFGYTINGATAAATKIQILDANGNIVRNAAGQIAAGAQSYAWDGRDDNGKLLANGTYSVRVTATDAAGKAVDVSTNTSGRVTNVSLQDNSVILTVGSSNIPLTKVLSVRDTPAA